MVLDAFPAGKYLSHKPPHYNNEWNDIIRNITALTILFMVIFPMIAKMIYAPGSCCLTSTSTSTSSSLSTNQKESSTRHGKSSSSCRNSNDSNSNRGSTKTVAVGKNRKNNATKRNEVVVPNTNTSAGTTTARNGTSDDQAGKRGDSTIASSDDSIPGYLLPLLNLIYLFSILRIIGVSPNNTYEARRVFIAPFLDSEECQTIIDMANVAAERNANRGRLRLLWNDDNNDNDNSTAIMPTEEGRKEAELVLKAPVGWKKE
mmetsp:Transcript_11686/g.13744  ORF Transcript_11686/g.13744 Transcript_11686/m.13744 type:complete len:260 (+) Transcript_11686:2-781(+)